MQNAVQQQLQEQHDALVSKQQQQKRQQLPAAVPAPAPAMQHHQHHNLSNLDTVARKNSNAATSSSLPAAVKSNNGGSSPMHVGATTRTETKGGGQIVDTVNLSNGSTLIFCRSAGVASSSSMSPDRKQQQQQRSSKRADHHHNREDDDVSLPLDRFYAPKHTEATTPSYASKHQQQQALRASIQQQLESLTGPQAPQTDLRAVSAQRFAGSCSPKQHSASVLSFHDL
jgi:hypothetical protein